MEDERQDVLSMPKHMGEGTLSHPPPPPPHGKREFTPLHMRLLLRSPCLTLPTKKVYYKAI